MVERIHTPLFLTHEALKNQRHLSVFATPHSSWWNAGGLYTTYFLEAKRLVPTDRTTPVLCIGPGTGVAPMRAVIQERVHAGITGDTLYFGCRHASKDHHYGAEWKELADEGKLAYRAAFSRDGPEGKARTYVQDLLREDAARVWELVGVQGAWVYISGSANKMPAAVRAAIAHAVRTEGGRTEEEAKEYVAGMEREGRLIEECWS